MFCRYTLSLESHECGWLDGVDMLREVQIACRVELALLRLKSTFVSRVHLCQQWSPIGRMGYLDHLRQSQF